MVQPVISAILACRLALLLCSVAPFSADGADLLQFIDSRGVRQVVKSQRDWAVRRGHIVENMERVMGRAPAPRSSAADVEVIAVEPLPHYERRRISFVSPDGDRVPALLLVPRGRGRRRAALCLHQTTRIGKAEPAGLGGSRNLHYADELARRGWVTLAPDYPNFGDYQADAYAMGYASTTRKGIENHKRAVDVLAALPEVDPRRIAALGHSLGGHNALFLAVFEPRVRAVATSCGFNSFRKYFGGNLKGWSHRGYMPRIAEVYGLSPDRMPFDFPEVLAAIAPRAVFINAPVEDANFEVSGVRDCVDAARPVYQRLFRAGRRLHAVYPQAGHDFPLAVRQQAYRFLEDALR